MSPAPSPALSLLVAALMAGCANIRATRVAEPPPAEWHYWFNPSNWWQSAWHTRPVEPGASARGTRYSLPKPYILVTPRPDGGIDVQPVVLADPAEEYAVEGWAFLASNKLEMTLEGGMLTKVVMEPDSGAVAAELAKNAGAFGKEVIDAEKKRAEEEAKAEVQTQKDILVKTVELETAIAERDRKQVDLGLAREALQRFKDWNAGKDPETDPALRDAYFKLKDGIRKSEGDLASANEKVDRLRRELETLQRKAGRAAGPQGRRNANKKGKNAVGSPKDGKAEDGEKVEEAEFPTFPGPMLFEVVTDPKTFQVSLVPVDFEIPEGTFGGVEGAPGAQLRFETFVAQSPGLPQPPHWLSLVEPVPRTVPRMQQRYEIRLMLQEVRAGEFVVRATPAGGAEKELPRPTPTSNLEDYWNASGNEVVVVLGSKDFKPGSCRVALVGKAGVRVEVQVELK